MAIGNKIYFLSDFHLGAPNAVDSLVREKKILSFLSLIDNEAAEIFVLGDMFDFWFEYKYVVPKGFVRYQSAILPLYYNLSFPNTQGYGTCNLRRPFQSVR